MERVILESGKSNYSIVTSKFAAEGVLYAASELYKYLFLSTNTLLPYYSDRCVKRGPEIRIGEGARGKREDLSVLSEEGYLIKTDGEDIIITGQTPRGVIYGVYRFLEQMIAFRCFTKDVETYDTLEKIVVPDLQICENPAFEYRDMYFRGAFDESFAVKNRLNSTLAMIPTEKGGKMKFFNLHHSFYDIIPPEKYFASHPEWFSEWEGERVYKKDIWDTQLCLTNPEMVEEAIQNVRNWIRSRPDCRVFSVAQNDSRFYCTCPKCRAVDAEEGSQAGTVIAFVNKIAERLQPEFPHVLFHTFAYWYSKKAPKEIRAADNVIVRLGNIECQWQDSFENISRREPESNCRKFIENLDLWAQHCKHLYIWDYTCNFANYLLPFPNFHALKENLKFYRDHHVAGVLEQGNFAYGNASGLAELKSYVGAKLLWNPDADVDDLIYEFTQGCYGSAGKYIREYVALLEQAVAKSTLDLYYMADRDFITDELVEKAQELFREALAQAETPQIYERLEREALSVEYLQLVRSPLDTPGRNARADALHEKLKKHHITEIFERKDLETSMQVVKNSRYCKERDNPAPIWMYYIMK